MHSTSLLKSVLKSQEFAPSSSAFGDNSYSNQKRSSKSSTASTSIDAPLASNRTASASGIGAPSKSPVKACLCAPTNHPGSFRCKFHRAKSASRASRVAATISDQASNLAITSASNTDKLANILTNNLSSNLPRKPFLAASIVSRKPVAGVRPPPTPLPSPSSAIPLDRGAVSRMAGSRIVGASRLSKVTTAAADRYGQAEKAEGNPFRFLKQAVTSGASVFKKGMNDDAANSGTAGISAFVLAGLLILSLTDSPGALAAGGGDRFYEVRPKDTLSAIARNFGTEVEVLLEANSLKSDVLQPGQKIWIPKTYNIQKGDTLSKIAKENSTTVGDILKINSIDNPDQILPGDILLLP